MIGRRTFLVASALGLSACTSGTTTPVTKAGKTKAQRIGYGDDPSQFGELSRADGRSRGTVVIIHGGFWRAQYGLELGRPLAADLVAHGWDVWNLEYRRIGNGGGWPTTLADVSNGIDKLDDLPVDTSAVVAVGHSAGGHLAVWAAGRNAQSTGPGANFLVGLNGVVSQAGVLDLATAAREGVGAGAPQQLAGGEPDDVPGNYAIADPIEQAPLDAPVYCLHSRADANVPFAQSSAYVAKAGRAAALQETDGDHFTLIDPTSRAWAYARDALPALAAGRVPG